jgi:drug/metabolite transporter (DMT)-like permease
VPYAYLVLRILSNPLANALQKVLTNRGVSAAGVIAWSHLVLSVLCVPILIRGGVRMPAGFWGPMVTCAVLAVASNVLLVAALARADLSVLGPINSYKAIISLVPSMVVLREVPSVGGLVGMGLILAGSYLLADPVAQGRRRYLAILRDRGVQLRLAALVLSATEAPFLKRATLASGSAVVTFGWWCVLGLAFAGPVAVVSGRGRGGRSAVGLIVLCAVATGVMQLSTLLTFAHFEVAYALALFQASTLLTVLLGHHLFDEPHLGRRLGASGVMIGGACLIVLSG